MRPEPKSDESLIGYILRLSDENGYETPNPILELLGVPYLNSWTRRVRLLSSGELNLERLSILTNKPVITFDSLVFQPITSQDHSAFRVGLSDISDELMNFNRPAVCIQCLAESNYHRRIWCVAAYTVCHKHLTLLHDKCSSCGWIFNWAKPSLLRCRCNVEMSVEHSTPIDFSETVLAQMTVEAVTHQMISGHPLITDMPSLYAVIHLGYMLSTRYSWSDAELDLSRQITSVRHTEILDAFKPFANWPTSFHQYLAEQTAIKRATYPAFSTPALFHQLNMTLDRSPLRKSQPAIYEAVANEVSVFINSNKTSREVTKITPELIVEDKLITRDETFDLLAISASGFAQLINFHLKPPSSDGMYSLHDVMLLKNTLSRLVTISEAENILNLSRHNTNNLLKNKVIHAFRSPDIDGYRDILIDAKVLNDLLTTIEETPPKESEQQGVSLALFFRQYQIKSAKTLDELINAVLDGGLPIAQFDKEAGLMGIIFSANELLQFIDFKTEDTRELLDINAIIVELNSYRDAVYRIMSAGLLAYEEEKINLKSKQRYVKPDELARFKTKYIMPSEIAVLYGANVTNITERFKHLGVLPISGPTIDNGLVYVFERSDVVGISKEQLDAVQGYQTRAGRPKKGQETVKGAAKSSYLDAQAVVDLLGNSASIQKVARLVKKGLLQKVQHNGELGNKSFFTPESVQLYLDSFRENPKLIKLEAIPDWLSIDERRLKIDWLSSSRLGLIDDGLGQRYANIEDLERIKAIRLYALSTQELAESVGKTRFDVGNAIRLGKLKPISGPSCDNFPNFLFDRESSIKSFA